MKKNLITFALIVALLAVGYFGFRALVYPADLTGNEDAYRKLVQLTLNCCTDGDYMAGIDAVDANRQRLMQRLGINYVHYYPGNPQSPGAVVFLERRVAGGLGSTYVYSLNRTPKSITSCYTSEHLRGRWYRGHSLLCLP